MFSCLSQNFSENFLCTHEVSSLYHIITATICKVCVRLINTVEEKTSQIALQNLVFTDAGKNSSNFEMTKTMSLDESLAAAILEGAVFCRESRQF